MVSSPNVIRQLLMGHKPGCTVQPTPCARFVLIALEASSTARPLAWPLSRRGQDPAKNLAVAVAYRLPVLAK